MNTDALIKFFNLVHEIYPLPAEGSAFWKDGTVFKGTHALLLNREGELELGVWVLGADGEIQNYPIWADPGDIFDRAELLKVKAMIEQSEVERLTKKGP